ncbi:MAG: DUF1684 domain-containing protein [Ignavibacteriales bacterium]|nr:MAG: DUF1684 domain-containing protein [Ignavibacteriales bacterium]
MRNESKIVRKVFLIYFLVLPFIFLSCGKEYTSEEKKYISGLENFRQEKNEYMQNDPDSPFNFKGKVHFSSLNYYDPDPEFVFKSKLFRYDNADTITIFGTKGEERKVLRFGYVNLNYKDNQYKVNVSEGVSKTGEIYYSIWFTDKTTGEETYGVGRYIDFEINPDTNFIYTIDFNLAYNPYCAYSPEYSCAIPAKEDYIDLAIEAGEKNFH